MKILVTGGTGVIGRATVTELLRRGHVVRLLSRAADTDAGAWDGAIEPVAADIGHAGRITGTAQDCDAVLHIVGIVEEVPPDLTFQRINIDGTINVVAEAERARVNRLIYISSLGADRGASAYHRSKFAGEEIVTRFRGEWTIVRVGPVIGPGDETVSVLLRMLRTLPAVPVIDSGAQPFQPVWHEDVAHALADCIERTDLHRALLNLAGAETITVAEVLDHFERITGRSPLRLPVPAFLARLGSSLAHTIGVQTPVSAATLQMLLEGSYLRDSETNDLLDRFGCPPAPLQERLLQLVDALPEQTPDAGVGKLERRRFTSDIQQSGYRARDLARRFREHFADMVPFEAAAEPGAPPNPESDATLTLGLPLRGHVQVRVVRTDDRSLTLATVEGHPLAGVVHFEFQDLPRSGVRFTIDIYERPASRIDQISMKLFGALAQQRTWKQTAEEVARQAGGTIPDGVQEQSWRLDDDDAEPVEEYIRSLVQKRQRRQENRV